MEDTFHHVWNTKLWALQWSAVLKNVETVTRLLLKIKVIQRISYLFKALLDSWVGYGTLKIKKFMMHYVQMSLDNF